MMLNEKERLRKNQYVTYKHALVFLQFLNLTSVILFRFSSSFIFLYIALLASVLSFFVYIKELGFFEYIKEIFTEKILEFFQKVHVSDENEKNIQFENAQKDEKILRSFIENNKLIKVINMSFDEIKPSTKIDSHSFKSSMFLIGFEGHSLIISFDFIKSNKTKDSQLIIKEHDFNQYNSLRKVEESHSFEVPKDRSSIISVSFCNWPKNFIMKEPALLGQDENGNKLFIVGYFSKVGQRRMSCLSMVKKLENQTDV